MIKNLISNYLCELSKQTVFAARSRLFGLRVEADRYWFLHFRPKP